jgi:hypothetical protein
MSEELIKKNYKENFTGFLNAVNSGELILPECLYIMLFCIFWAFVLIVYYVLIIIANLAPVSKNKTVLNIESIEYATIYYLSGFNIAYIWTAFLGIAFFALVAFKFMNSKSAQSLTVVNIGLFALSVAIVLQITIIFFASKSINNVKMQADSLNTYIRTNIYKKAEFLNKLKTPKSDTNYKHATIVDCVGILKKEKNVTELAKGFYTLTLYNYYNEFSANNEKITRDAYKIFDMLALFNMKNKLRPVAYMPRYGTFIEDIGETKIRPHMSPTTLVNDAMFKCDMFVSITNELANTIYPDQAYNVFILMLVTTILINVLMVGSVFYYGIYEKRGPALL